MVTSERGRFSAKRKRDAVLRLLRGEDVSEAEPLVRAPVPGNTAVEPNNGSY